VGRSNNEVEIEANYWMLCDQAQVELVLQTSFAGLMKQSAASTPLRNTVHVLSQ
jgi:hypothetical protein